MPSAKSTADDPSETSSPPLPEDEVFSFAVQAAEVTQSAKGAYAHLKLVVRDHPEHANRIVWEVLPLPNEFLFAARLAETIQSEQYPWNQALSQHYPQFIGLLYAIGCEIGQGVTLEVRGGQKVWNVTQLLGCTFQAKAVTEICEGRAQSRIGEYLPRIS